MGRCVLRLMTLQCSVTSTGCAALQICQTGPSEKINCKQKALLYNQSSIARSDGVSRRNISVPIRQKS